MRFERIAYAGHAYKRLRERHFTHSEVKRVIHEPEITHPADKPDRIMARCHSNDGRRMGVVYTEGHERDADVLVVSVIDFDAIE